MIAELSAILMVSVSGPPVGALFTLIRDADQSGANRSALLISGRQAVALGPLATIIEEYQRSNPMTLISRIEFEINYLRDELSWRLLERGLHAAFVVPVQDLPMLWGGAQYVAKLDAREARTLGDWRYLLGCLDAECRHWIN
jgi:hypothetical protein